jgi:hypothetical protein
MKYCQNCGTKAEANSLFCEECGFKLVNAQTVQPLNYRQANGSANPGEYWGQLGFFLAMISLFLPVPLIDIFIGVLALIVSSVGFGAQKKGWAIAGFILGFIAIIGSIGLLLTDGYNFF